MELMINIPDFFISKEKKSPAAGRGGLVYD